MSNDQPITTEQTQHGDSHAAVGDSFYQLGKSEFERKTAEDGWDPPAFASLSEAERIFWITTAAIAAHSRVHPLGTADIDLTRPITRQEWASLAEQVYRECGYDADTAREQALWLSNQEDWFRGEVTDPRLAAQEDVKGCPRPKFPIGATMPEIEWPQVRDVGRIEDMGDGYLRVLLDSDNDVRVEVFTPGNNRPAMASVEFCNPGGGGHSRRTRAALIELMRAITDDNIQERGYDLFAARMARQTARVTPQTETSDQANPS